MRHKRAKVYKRAMGIYTQAFGFREPFQILVSQDVLLSLNRESDIRKQLSACVQGVVKPMITQCCIDSLYKMGKDHQPVVDIAKTFERRKCNHREAIDSDECLKDVIGDTNKHRYVLASQSTSLRTRLSAIPGLPLIHFNPRGVLVQSPPSLATLRRKINLEEERRVEGSKALEGVEDGVNVLGVASSSILPPARRSRVKGPNPLSVKKKKVKTDENDQPGPKRSREDGEDGGGVNAETLNDAGEARKKKKRKRRGKGEVAKAIEEIQAGNLRDSPADSFED